MRQVLIGVAIGVIVISALNYVIGGLDKEMPELSPEARQVVKVERIVDATRVRDLEYQLGGEREARTAAERELVDKIKVIARLEARLAKRPVKVVPGDPPPPVIVPCPDGGEVVCPPQAPPQEVVINGGCDVQLVRIEGRQAATADWWASVYEPELGWFANLGPERVDDLVYFQAPSSRPKMVSWAIGGGFIDSEKALTLRRTVFPEGRAFGWWGAIDVTDSGGGVRGGLELRGGRRTAPRVSP